MFYVRTLCHVIFLIIIYYLFIIYYIPPSSPSLLSSSSSSPLLLLNRGRFVGQDFELNYANAVQGFCSQRCVPPTEALETNSMEIGLSHGRSHYTKTKNSKIGKIPNNWYFTMLFHAKNSVSNATPCYFGANNWHQFGANYCRCAP